MLEGQAYFYFKKEDEIDLIEVIGLTEIPLQWRIPPMVMSDSYGAFSVIS